MSLTCLDTLIGLSKTDYECFLDTKPDDFDASDSGYHLTDTDYGLTIIDNCSLAGWGILSAAKSQAIAELKSDLSAILRQTYDSALSPFSGEIGKRTQNDTLRVNKDRIGTRARVNKQIRGAEFRIKEIWLGLDTSGDYQIVIDSNDELFEQDPISITTVAGQFAQATLDDEIILPLFSEVSLEDRLTYFLSVALSSGERPLNNLFTCCGKVPLWNKHLDFSGFQSNDTNPCTGSFTTHAQGFIIKGYFYCNELDWICQATELGGYHLKDVLARSAQFRGAAIATSALIDDLKVDPCTGYQIENLMGRRSYLNKRYRENLEWIAENLPSGITGCFACKEETFFKKSTILS